MHTRSQDRQDKLSAIMELGGLRSNKKGEKATPAKPEPAPQSNDHQMDGNASAPTPAKQKSKTDLLKQKMKLLQKKKKEQQVQSSHEKIQKAEGEKQSKIIDQTVKEPGYEQSIKATQLPPKVQPEPKKDQQPKKGKDLLAVYLQKLRKSKEQSESSKKEQFTPDNKIASEAHKNVEPPQPAQFVEKQGEIMEPERQEQVVKSDNHGQEEIVKPSEMIDQEKEKEKEKLQAEETRRQMQMQRQRQRRQREEQRHRQQQEQARKEKEKQAQAARLQLLTELSTKQSQRLKQKTKQQNIRKLQAQLQQLKEERAKSKPVQSQPQPAPVPVPVPTQTLQEKKDSKQVQEQKEDDEIEVQQDQVQYEDEEEEEEEVWKDGKRVVPHQQSQEAVQKYEQYHWQKHPLVCQQLDTPERGEGDKKLKIRQKIVLKQIFKLRNCINKFNPSSKPTPQLKPSQFAILIRQHTSTLSQLIHPT